MGVDDSSGYFPFDYSVFYQYIYGTVESLFSNSITIFFIKITLLLIVIIYSVTIELFT